MFKVEKRTGLRLIKTRASLGHRQETEEDVSRTTAVDNFLGQCSVCLATIWWASSQSILVVAVNASMVL